MPCSAIFSTSASASFHATSGEISYCVQILCATISSSGVMPSAAYQMTDATSSIVISVELTADMTIV
jgi:hypothetical protein